MAEKRKILEVKHLKKYFPLKKGKFKEGDPCVKAVDDITFDLYEGETLGLVGESGCGKSTLGRTIIRLYEPTSGEVIFEGEDVAKKSRKEMRALREEMQFIFQDPYSSLNPRMTVGDIIGEGIDIHKLYTGKERQEKIYELLELVGLNREHALRFPHEFSGGQRQRIGIARALAMQPDILCFDEPTSALDPELTGEVLKVLRNLAEKKTTMIIVTHEMAFARDVASQVIFMDDGYILEQGRPEEVFDNPEQERTKQFLSSYS